MRSESPSSMVRVAVLAMVALLTLFVAGCRSNDRLQQSPSPDAAELEIKLSNESMLPPNRTIESVKAKFIETDFKHKSACDDGVFYYALEPESGQSGIDPGHLAYRWRESAHDALLHGDFTTALSYIRIAKVTLPRDWALHRSSIGFTEAAYLAIMGDRESAASRFSTARRDLVHGKSYNTYRKYKGKFESPRIVTRGFALFAEGDYRAAELYLRDSFFRPAHDVIDFVALPYLTAYAIAFQGRLAEAEAVARDWLDSLADPMEIAWLAEVLSYILLQQGRYTDAEWISRFVITFLEGHCAPPHYFFVYRHSLHLVTALANQGKWRDVLPVLEKLQVTARESSSEILHRLLAHSPNVGVGYLSTGDFVSARRAFLQARSAILRRTGADSPEYAEIQALLSLADYMIERTSRSMAAFEDALLFHLRKTGRLLDNLEQSATRESRTALMVEMYLSMAASSPSLLKSRENIFLIAQGGQGGRVTAALSASSLRSAAPDPALKALTEQYQNVANRIRQIGRVMADHVAENRPEGGATLAELNAELQSLASVRPVLAEQIAARVPEFVRFNSNVPLTVGEVSALLQPDEAAILIRSFEHSSYVFAVGSGNRWEHAEIAAGRAEIGELVQRLLAPVNPGFIASVDEIPDFDLRGAHELYARLLLPIRRGWQDAENLIIVPDGDLTRLPFSMLVTEDAGHLSDRHLLFDRYQRVAWLAKSHAVTLLPSINTLAYLRLREGARAEQQFIGFGDPLFNESHAAAFRMERAGSRTVELRSEIKPRSIGLRATPDTRGLDTSSLEDLPRLRDTAEELDSIARSLGADPVHSVLTGDRATEQQVKSRPLDDYNVVVFATHGLAIGDIDGLYEPALALTNPEIAGAPGDDGLLSLTEIMQLRLNAEWVVLSACNTAGSDGRGAEIVSGLGRAFFFAGARSVLATNWPVESSSAKTLTSTLFAEYVSDAYASPAQALRRAQLALIGGPGRLHRNVAQFSLAHPLFWAGFALYGA